MEVIWTEKALEGWNRISLYILTDFGHSALQSFIEHTYEVEQTISFYPNMGTIEWEGKEGIEYRSMTIYRRSKLLYFVKDEFVYIADFWDVRQDKQ